MPVPLTCRVVVVDDSDLAARRIETILEGEPGVHVLARFSGVEAFLAWPDLETATVVVLDMWMPGTSGLAALRTIASRVPVVVVSEAAADSELALEALAQGAAAFVSKRELGNAIGEARLRAAVVGAASRTHVGEPPVLLVVGSTGAPRALELLLPELRGAMAAIVIVQHLPIGGEVGFTRWVSGFGLPASIARTGDPLRPDHALVAPAGAHLLLQGRGTVRLVPGSEGDLHVPSADRALSSAAFLGRRLVALVLSGMGRDGRVGLAAAVAQGAIGLAQHPDDAAAPSMPTAALGVSPRIRPLHLETIGQDIREALRRSGR